MKTNVYQHPYYFQYLPTPIPLNQEWVNNEEIMEAPLYVKADMEMVKNDIMVSPQPCIPHSGDCEGAFWPIVNETFS